MSVARALGVAPSTVSRIERGLHPEVSVLALARCASVVGLDLTVKLFPGGQPLRDQAHVRLLLGLRGQLHPGLRWATEVPVRAVDSRDLRAWDAAISGRSWEVGVEAETAPRDGQALTRRLNLKLRDGDIDGLILLLPATRATRTFLAEAREYLMPILPSTVARSSWRCAPACGPRGVGSSSCRAVRLGVRRRIRHQLWRGSDHAAGALSGSALSGSALSAGAL